MGSPRSYGGAQATAHEDDDFDDAPEVRCINVSPYTARLELATTPGTKPRRHKLEPGQGVYLQHGYTVPFLSPTGATVRPTIEALSEREAWPGRRDYNADDKLVWLRKPGPRLPMIVPEDRAGEVKAQWAAAMAEQATADAAPLKLTLQRPDGREVQVEAEIEPVKARTKAAPAAADDDEVVAFDDPPPDHDEPLDAVQLPTADDLPTRAAARARGKAPT